MNDIKMIDNISANLSVKIIRTHCIRHESNWHEQKVKLCYSLWWVTEGAVSIRMNHKNFRLVPGDAVLFYPGNSYKAHTEEDGCTFVFCMFNINMGDEIDLLSSMNLSGIFPKSIMGTKNEQICGQISSLYTTAQHIPFKLYAAFIAYFAELIDMGNANKNILFFEEYSPPFNSLMKDVYQYMNEHFTEDITMKQLCAIAGLSEKHFISSFKRMTGVSPGKYILQCRMHLAAELLLATDKKISEISEITGYANPYAFSKAFKKFYEEAPLYFKKHFIY